VLRCHLAALGAYVCLGLLLLWPLPTVLPHAVIGTNTIDAFMNVWNMWWVHAALAGGQSPFWSDALFYPDGVQMYVQTMNVLNGLLTLPVTALAGPVAAYNTALLLAIVLTGYGAFVLANCFVDDAVAAWVAGGLLAASPFLLLRVDAGQSNLVAIQWFPLGIAALLHVERDRPGVKALAAIGASICIGLTDWYYALVWAVFVLCWCTTRLLLTSSRRALAARYLVIGGGTAAGLLPLMIGMVTLRNALPSTDLATDRHWRAYIQGFSADALGAFFPSVLHPLWGQALTDRLYTLAPGPFVIEGWYIAPGLALLLCGALGAWQLRHTHAWLLVLAGAMYVFALGPSLRIAGLQTGVPLPYAALEAVPLLSTARRPALFAVPGLCILAGLAAVGIAWLRARWRHKAARLALIALAGLALVELWPRVWPVTAFDVPPVYARLRDAEAGAVADLPIIWTETSDALRHQIVHGHAILGGYVARWPANPSFHFQPLINQLGEMRRWESPDIVPLDSAALRAMQCAAPVRHVVIDGARAAPGQIRAVESLLSELAGAPVVPDVRDAPYRWYRVPVDTAACQPFVYLGTGWQPAEHDAERVWRWMKAVGEVLLVNPQVTPVRVQLIMDVGSLVPDTPAELWHGEQRLGTWQASSGGRHLRLITTLAPGTNRLQLRAPVSPDPEGRRVSLTVTSISVQPIDRVTR
jgi:hypothetical protein